MDELHTFKKMSVSDSEQGSLDSSSNTADKIWKISSSKLFNFYTYHNSKKLKQNSERFSLIKMIVLILITIMNTYILELLVNQTLTKIIISMYED